MNILLLGARGFIGSRIAAVLRACGHTPTTSAHHEAGFFALVPARVRPLFTGQDEVLSLAAYPGVSRQTVHRRRPPRILPIPLALLLPFLLLTSLPGNGVPSAGNIRLLQEGSTADNHTFTTLLQRVPLAPAAFAAQL